MGSPSITATIVANLIAGVVTIMYGWQIGVAAVGVFLLLVAFAPRGRA